MFYLVDIILNYLLLENYIYICHFCSKEFFNRDILFAHFQQCQIKNSTTPVTKSSHQQYSLTQTELDILHS